MATEETLRLIIEAKDRASRELTSIRDALNTIAGLEIVRAARAVFSALLNVFKELASDALVAVGSYERLGISLGSLAAQELLMAERGLEMADAIELSRGRARELLEFVTELALKSPFTEEAIAAGLRLSMVYGMNSEQAMELSQALVDYAAGTGLTNSQLYRLALAMAQVSGRGKLMGQEMRQFANAGLGVAQIAYIMGIEIDEVAAAMKAGAITADKLIPGFVALSNRNFAGQAAAQALAWAGLTETLGDVKKIGLRKVFGEYNVETGKMTGIMGQLQPVMAAFIEQLTSPETLAAFERLGEILGAEFAENVDDLADALPTVVDALAVLLPLLIDIAGPMVKEGVGTLTEFADVAAKFTLVMDSLAGFVEAVIDPTAEVNRKWKSFIDYIKLLMDWAQPLDNILRFLADRFHDIAHGLDELTEMYKAWRRATKGGGEVTVGPIGNGSAFQFGGIASGGLALVGEGGPELVNLPRGSKVWSNRETQGMMGGTTIYVTVGSVGGDPYQGGQQIGKGILAELRVAGSA